eukprot:2659018-Prymnesium_polylepis.1
MRQLVRRVWYDGGGGVCGEGGAVWRRWREGWLEARAGVLPRAVVVREAAAVSKGQTKVER